MYDDKERDVHINIDRPHAGKEAHVDLTKPFDKGQGQPGFGAHKIEVYSDGTIVDQGVV